MPQKLRPSYKFNDEQLEQLKRIVPEAFKDGMLDFNSLFDALSDYNEEDSLDMDDNFYGLYWPGKRKAKRNATIPPNGTLVPIKGNGVDEEKTKNIYIEGDNLEVLKLLQKSYAGKIKMIYIDPPYNTGNDFIYNDDFSETAEDFEKATGQIDEQGVKQTVKINSRADGRFHSKWLNMMYPRLKLAHRLLNEDGVIFISIDDNEVAQLRKICDEIFGEENFVAQVIVQTNPRGRTFDRFFAKTHEYVLVYSNQIDIDGLNEIPKDDKAIAGYSKEDTGGKYRLLELRNRNPVFNRSNRPLMFYPIYADPKQFDVSLTLTERHIVEIYPRNSKGEDGCWTWGQKKAKNEITLLVANLANTGKWSVFRKDYLEGSSLTTKSKALWLEKEMNHENGKEIMGKLFGKTPFDFPKSIEYIKKCLQIGSSKYSDDIILDFFSGSSTTAHAVMQLNAEDSGNRQFIMVQLPEKCDEKSEAHKAGFKNICEIGKERIRRAGKSIAENKQSAVNNQPSFNDMLLPPPPPPIDIGFKVYRLAPSNYKKWKNYAGNDIKEAENLFAQYENPLVDNWKEEDLLTEIMLIEGFPLDSAVSVIKDFKKNKVTQISSEFCEHSLFVCLDNTINAETINTLALSEHDIFICLDNAVTDQDKARLDDKGLIKTI